MINWDSIKHDVSLSKILEKDISDKSKKIFDILNDFFSSNILDSRYVQDKTVIYTYSNNKLTYNYKLTEKFIQEFPYDYIDVQSIVKGYIRFKYNKKISTPRHNTFYNE